MDKDLITRYQRMDSSMRQEYRRMTARTIAQKSGPARLYAEGLLKEMEAFEDRVLGEQSDCIVSVESE